jgi:hypothetical protein
LSKPPRYYDNSLPLAGNFSVFEMFVPIRYEEKNKNKNIRAFGNWLLLGRSVVP